MEQLTWYRSPDSLSITLPPAKYPSEPDLNSLNGAYMLSHTVAPLAMVTETLFGKFMLSPFTMPSNYA